MITKKTVSSRINRTAAITYFAIVVVFALMKILSHYGVMDFLGGGGKMLLSGGMQVVLLGMIPMVAMCFSLKQKPLEVARFYGYKKISWKGIVLAVLIGIVVYILNVFFTSFISTFLASWGYSSGASQLKEFPVSLLILELIFVAILPAICEETSHRGMLLGGMSAGRKRSKAIFLSSLMFGLMHCNIAQFFHATVIGLLLAYIVSVSENIYPAIIIHFMNNALSVVMSYSRFHNLGFDFISSYTFEFISNNFFLGIVFAIVLIIILLVILKFLINRLFKSTILKQLNDLNQRILIEIERDDYFENMESIIKTGQIYKPSEMEDFARFKALFYHFGKDYGFTSKIKTAVGDEPMTRDKIATAFYVTSFVILGIMTVLSFVWGVI